MKQDYWQCKACSDDTEIVLNPPDNPSCLSCGKSRAEQHETGAKRDLAILPSVVLPKQANSHLIRFTVYGQPQPKGRPRFGNKNAYTPAETKQYQKQVAQIASLQIDTLFTGDLFVHLQFYRKIQRGKKPDTDNLAKAVLDAMEGIAYKNDDSVRKLFSEIDYVRDNPRVVITITHSENWMQALAVIPIESEAA